MIRIAWRSLLARKLRSFLTAARDPARRGDDQRHLRLHRPDQQGFDDIFSEAYKGTDVTITPKASFTGELTAALAGHPRVAAVEDVRAVDGVAEAERLRLGHGRDRRERQGGPDRRLADAVLLVRRPAS